MTEKNKLLNLSEAARFLDIGEEELKSLAEAGKIPAYKVGGVFLRFKLEQLSEAKPGIREKLDDSSNDTQKTVPMREPEKITFLAGMQELWYFYDFYIIAFLVIVFIIWLIFKIGL